MNTGRRSEIVAIAGPVATLWVDEGGVPLPTWTVEVVIDRVWTRTYWFQTLQGAERFTRDLDASSRRTPSSGGTTSP